MFASFSFSDGKSDKEILDILLKDTRYDKRLLPPVDGEYKEFLNFNYFSVDIFYFIPLFIWRIGELFVMRAFATLKNLKKIINFMIVKKSSENNFELLKISWLLVDRKMNK